MNADTCKKATVKETLTVQIWGFDSQSVVKVSLTTDALRRADFGRLTLATCERRLQVRMESRLAVLKDLSCCCLRTMKDKK